MSQDTLPRGIAGKSRHGFALGLALLFAAEFFLFDRIGAKHYTWVYPRWNDQIQYLTESYTGYEYLREHGFWAGLWQTLVNRSAQGTFHDFFAVLVFCVAGPSRSAVLSLNILAVIAWQAALVFAVSRTTGSRALAWMAAAMPLLLAWPWRPLPGSAFDFRLDHMAMCAIGVCHAASLLTRGFESRRWSAVFGAAVGFTLSLRFLTGTYFALIFAGLAIVLVFFRNGEGAGNLGIAAAIAAVLAGPLYWMHRETIWNYYFVLRFTGTEMIARSAHFNWGESFRYVTGRLATEHLGIAFWLTAGAGLLILVAGRASHKQVQAAPGSARFDAMAAALFLLAPTTVLIWHTEKSELTFSAIVPGAFGLFLAASRSLAGSGGSRWAFAAAAAMLLGGMINFTTRQLADPYGPGFVADARRVNIVADTILRRSQAAGLKAPRIAVDAVTDSFDAMTLSVICYERHNVWIRYGTMLPLGVVTEDEALIMGQLASSDFVFLTEDGPVGHWPFDGQMRALSPKTRAWCEANLKLAERFEIFGTRMALYQRPGIPLEITGP